jgi:shikimate kinase
VNIILIGYRGSGKSTVGQILAARLGWQFVDLDGLVVQKAGQSITQIFATDGEPSFRKREKEALQSLRRVSRHVIAAGGGAVLEQDNRNLIKRIGKAIWLRAPAVALWSRISKDDVNRANRPNLTAYGGLQEVERQLTQREPVYDQVAVHIVDTLSVSPSEIAESIELWLEASDSSGD